MLQTATKPFEQPTAISLGDSQARVVHTAEEGNVSKAGDVTLTIFACQS